MIHKLKTQSEHFANVKNGKKTFEIRRDDRDFQIGDAVILKELGKFCPIETGTVLFFEITYITSCNQKEGYVVFGMVPVDDVTPYEEEEEAK